MTTIETTDDGNIMIHVEMCLRRFSGQKKTIIPEGDFDPTQINTRDDGNRVVLLALARAHHWRKLIEAGKCQSPLEIAERVNSDAGYIRKIMRLNDLSPRIVRRILDGTAPDTLTLNKLINRLPYSWEEQEKKFLG